MSKSKRAETCADIVAACSPERKGSQALALFYDVFSVLRCDFGRRCFRDVEIESDELRLRFRGEDDLVHHLDLRAVLCAALSDARTLAADTARRGLAFMAS